MRGQDIWKNASLWKDTKRGFFILEKNSQER